MNLLAVDDDTPILLRDGRIANSKLNWPKLPGTPLAAVKKNAHSGLCLCQLADNSLQLLRLEDGRLQVLGTLPGTEKILFPSGRKNDASQAPLGKFRQEFIINAASRQGAGESRRQRHL